MVFRLKNILAASSAMPQSATGQSSISAVGRKTAAGIRQDGAGAGGQVRHPWCGRAGNGLDSEGRDGCVPSCRSRGRMSVCPQTCEAGSLSEGRDGVRIRGFHHISGRQVFSQSRCPARRKDDERPAVKRLLHGRSFLSETAGGPLRFSCFTLRRPLRQALPRTAPQPQPALPRSFRPALLWLWEARAQHSPDQPQRGWKG